MNGRRNDAMRRDFAGRGPLINLLRALHLVGVVGTGGAVLGAPLAGQMNWYAALMVGSGVGIAALDRWADRSYFSQLNGQWVAFKLLCVGIAAWLAGLGAGLFWALLVVSALMTHAPAWLRHKKLF